MTLSRSDFTAALLAAGVIGCARPRQFDFACPDGATIRAAFLGDSVHIAIGGQHLDLPQAPSASGARYSDGEWVFWNKGREALLQYGDRTLHEHCVAPER